MADVIDDAPVTTSKTARPARELVGVAVTINRPAHELYAFWRDLPNLAAFMENVEQIEMLDDRRSRWRVKAPAGESVEWEAEIIDDCPGESLTWRSVEGADIDHSGKIAFIDAGARGTVARAVIAYEPPAGFIGRIAAKLFQREPAIQARRDLRRFKQLMETGEIATAARNRAEFEKRGN